MSFNNHSIKSNHIRNCVLFRVIFTLFISVTLGFLDVKAQVSPEEIKASLIIHFCENIDWARPIKGEFTIGCYTDDESVYRVLNKGMKIVKVQGKSIAVKRLTSKEGLGSCHALYYDKPTQAT